MLYRKYRPQKFAELVGLESVKKTLLSQVKDKKIVHAYLFAGPRGTGKTTTARILAKAINCQHSAYSVQRTASKGSKKAVSRKPLAVSSSGEPCGTCQVCKQIEEGRYLDLIEIDAASNRGIDDIRALRERVKLAPSSGKYKVYIIDEAHMLTPEAFNALLKTLEEPPGHVIFVLCTTEPYKLPETIRSRCQRFNFERASVKLIVERLKDICSREKAKLGEKELTEIAKASGGGFRDAETLLEQVITGGQRVGDLVGLATLDNLEEFFDLLIAGNAAPAFVYVNDLYDKGVSMESFNQKVLEYLRDLLLIKVGVGESLVEVGKERFAKMQGQAAALTSQQLSNMINKFTQSYENLAQSSIPTLPLEVAVVEATSQEAGGKRQEARSGQQEEKEGKKQQVPAVEQSSSRAVEQWNELMRRIKPLNHSVEALLRSCEPARVKGRELIVRALYPFHKERLEEPKNKTVLEQVAKEVYGKTLRLVVKLVRSK